MGNNPCALGVLLGVLAALGSGAPSARASGDGDCGRLLLTREEGGEPGDGGCRAYELGGAGPQGAVGRDFY